MSEDTKAESEDTKTEKQGYWDKTVAWVQRNPVVAGAAAGFGAGTVVPGVGNVVGAVGGALVGYMHKKSQETK